MDRIRDIEDQLSTEQSKGSNASRSTVSSLISQRDDLLKQTQADTIKLTTEAKNMGASAAQVEALSKAETEDKFPTRRNVPTYNAVTPTRPGTGGAYSGKVFPSPESLKSAFPGKSPAEIRQIVEGNGGRFTN